MATGDQSFFAGRLRSLLPRGWFGDQGTTPFLDGILSGLGYLHATGFAWVQFSRGQLRLSTTSGEFLDDLAADFLGTAIARKAGESDAAFRIRIRQAVFAPKVTRAAILAAVQNLVGTTPVMVEPRNSSDTGGYASTSVQGGGGVGYGMAGAYGSRLLPYQAFLTVQRPITAGVPAVAGYNSGASGYGSVLTPKANVGPSEYASAALAQGISDADIYALIADTSAAGVVIWTRIVDPTPAAGARLDINLFLDRSQLG